MFLVWKLFDEEIDKLLERKSKYSGDDFYNKYFLNDLQKKIEKHFFLEQRVNEVFNLLQSQFKLSEETLKSIFLPNSSLFKLSNKEIMLRFRYYIDFFGNIDLLCKVIKNSSVIYGKNILFSWKDMHQAQKQFDWLKDFFNLNENETRLFIIYNTYFFVIEPKILEEKVNDYARVLGVGIDVIKHICLFSPIGFYSIVERLEEKINGFSKIFDIDISKTKEIFVKYPFIIDKQITTFRDCFNILKKYSKNISLLMTENPFIINLLDYEGKKYNGDFDTFEEFIESIEFIEQNIGTIIRTYTYVCYSKLYSFCIVKKNNDVIECIIFGLKSDKFNTKVSNSYAYRKWIFPYYTLKSCREIYVEERIKEILLDISAQVE